MNSNNAAHKNRLQAKIEHSTQINRIQKVFAIFLLIATIFSAAFCTAEHDHDCCGEDCPICAIIQIAEFSLKLLAVCLSFASSKFFETLIEKKAVFTKTVNFFHFNTLFLQKTRLND